MNATITTERSLPKTAKRARYTVDLPHKISDEINKIAEEAGETKIEVIRKAISFYLRCNKYRENGYDSGAFKESENGQIKLVSII